MQALVHELNNRCWKLCSGSGKLSTKLDSRTETCLSNCVDRFIDASNFMANRITSLASQSTS
ncbi:Tim10-like, partial [Trinorchestia longiramus]